MNKKTMAKIYLSGEYKIVRDVTHPNAPYALYKRSVDISTGKSKTRLIGWYERFYYALEMIAGEAHEIGF